MKVFKTCLDHITLEISNAVNVTAREAVARHGMPNPRGLAFRLRKAMICLPPLISQAALRPVGSKEFSCEASF